MCSRGLKNAAIIALATIFMVTMDGFFRTDGFQGVTVAEAQQTRKLRKKRRTLLEILFGAPRRVIRKKRKSRRIKNPRRTKRRAAAVAAPVIPVIEKLEDAKVVLVVGDFFAGGLAKGLTRTFNQAPGVRIVKSSKGSSGFVRLDYFDWATEITAIVDERKPSVIVVMLGTNDRQLMRLDGARLPRRSEEWDVAYKARIDNFAKAATRSKIPLIWMGLPPVRFKSMSQDFLFFNEVYRSGVEKVGGQFVDVWDGFTDTDGNFVTSGPNVAGQIVRLRAKDGINVTKAGQNKLAFFAEKAIKKYLGGYSAGALAGLRPSFDINAVPVEPAYNPARTGRSVIINLNDPVIDGGDVLAGGPDDKFKPELVADTQEVSSKQEYVAGRADDFSWPRKPLEFPTKPKPSIRKENGRIQNDSSFD